MTKTTFSFKGRINQKEFWLTGIIPTLILALAAAVQYLISMNLSQNQRGLAWTFYVTTQQRAHWLAKMLGCQVRIQETWRS